MAPFDYLTRKETALFTALCKVPDNTLWGLAISQVLEEPTVKRFRDLVKQLKSQAKDCPDTMKCILGPETLKLLLTSK